MLSWTTTAVAILGSMYLPWPLPPSVCLPVACMMLWLRRRHPRNIIICSLLALTLGMSVAALYCQWRLSETLPEGLEGRDLRLRLAVQDSAIDLTSERRVRIDAKVLELVDCAGLACPEALGKIRLTLYRPDGQKPGLAQGDEILATVRLKRPRGYASLGAFDYGRWLFANGYGASGYIRDFEVLESASQQRWRSKAIARVWQQVKSLSHGDLILALLFGEREAMSARRWAVLTDTGTGHLLAISGMHIGLVAGWGYLLGRLGGGLLQSSLWATRLPPLLALLLALGYGAMAGFSLPTRRALLMLTPFIIASLCQRRVNVWQSLSLALLGVALLDPMAGHQPGFFLSFGAVGLLFWRFHGAANRPRRSGFSNLLETQWLLGLGLVPLLCAWQFTLSSGSLLANLLAIPLVALVILPAILLGFVLSGGFPAAGQALWQLADLLLSGLFVYLERLQQWLPSGTLPATPIALVLGVIGCLLLLRPGLPAKAAAGLMLLPMLLSSPARPPAGQFDLRVLDVGQGLSAVITTAQHAMVYDLGPAYDSGFNTADAVVRPGLAALGIRTLDALVLSHNDQDHVGGAADFLEQVPTATVYHGEALSKALLAWSDRARQCHAGLGWVWDGVPFQFLHSPLATQLEGNDASCVLLIGEGQGRVVLPGDISATVEAQLAMLLPASAVVVAPHHGSNTSSSARFIAATNPALVIYSSGYKHHYGHPAPAVVSRYRQIGAECWATGWQGSVLVRLSSAGIQSLTPWRRYPWFWQDFSGGPCGSTKETGRVPDHP